MYKDKTLSLFAREALLSALCTERLRELSAGEDPDTGLLADRILRYRRARERFSVTSHRLNYPIEEVLDDYVSHRKGKSVEARRQLKKRFDGQDHPMQERIMHTFMEKGNLSERNFIYDKLYGEDFWVDEYIPLVESWWETFHDHKMAKVVIKRCPKEYLLSHLSELEEHGNYALLCIRTGKVPDPGKLSPQTLLYVMKNIGTVLSPGEGRGIILRAVRDYLKKNGEEWLRTTEGEDGLRPSIYSITYVRRMVLYLGEMGMESDILSIDEFDSDMGFLSGREWADAVIDAVEKEFPTPATPPSEPIDYWPIEDGLSDYPSDVPAGTQW